MEEYERLGWNVIPLEGKAPTFKDWQTRPYNINKVKEALTKGANINIGVCTGWLSGGLIAIDSDQPDFLAWDVEPAIRRGALVHTTSKGARIIFYTNNPEVEAFQRKIVLSKSEIEALPEKLKRKIELEEGKEHATILEILGNNQKGACRQFVAPPSIHPEKGIEYKWITSLEGRTKKNILHINSIEELKELLRECIRDKWALDIVFSKLFEDERSFKQHLKEKEKEQKKEVSADVLEKWEKIILEKLKEKIVNDRGDYLLIHCPFHPPDNKPSLAYYKNSKLFVDFHVMEKDETGKERWKVYTLKEFAKELGIELPKAKKGNEVEVEIELDEENKLWVAVVGLHNAWIRVMNGEKTTAPIPIGSINSADIPRGAVSKLQAELSAIGIQLSGKRVRELIAKIKAEIRNNPELVLKLSSYTKTKAPIENLNSVFRDNDYQCRSDVQGVQNNFCSAVHKKHSNIPNTPNIKRHDLTPCLVSALETPNLNGLRLWVYNAITRDEYSIYSAVKEYIENSGFNMTTLDFLNVISECVENPKDPCIYAEEIGLCHEDCLLKNSPFKQILRETESIIDLKAEGKLSIKIRGKTIEIDKAKLWKVETKKDGTIRSVPNIKLFIDLYVRLYGYPPEQFTYEDCKKVIESWFQRAKVIEDTIDEKELILDAVVSAITSAPVYKLEKRKEVNPHAAVFIEGDTLYATLEFLSNKLEMRGFKVSKVSLYYILKPKMLKGNARRLRVGNDLVSFWRFSIDAIKKFYKHLTGETWEPQIIDPDEGFRELKEQLKKEDELWH